MAKQKSEYVRIYNCSKQMVALQVRAPGSDFYVNEQQVRMAPGQDAMMPKSHLLMEQVLNLKKLGMITISYDSEN